MPTFTDWRAVAKEYEEFALSIRAQVNDLIKECEQHGGHIPSLVKLRKQLEELRERFQKRLEENNGEDVG
jgi:hypothetical protein